MNQVIKQKLDLLPTNSGVYVMRNASGQVIYVGKAKNLKNRVKSYFLKTQKTAKVEAMVNNIANLDYFVTPTEIDALALESNLIKKYKPHYNILLKDDKHFSYIKVNLKEDFPRFEITRKIKKDGYKYFGPYISGVSANELLKTIHLAFPLRTHKIKIFSSDNKKLKTNAYSISSVSAKQKISKEEYSNLVKQTIDFLTGKEDTVENILKEKMQKNASIQNFEQALLIRNKLKMIEKMKAKTIASLSKFLNLDAFGVYTDGLSSAVSVLVVRNGKMLGIKNFTVINASENLSDVLSQFVLQYYEKNIIPEEVLVSEKLAFKEELEETLKQKKEAHMQISLPKISVKAKLVSMAVENAKVHTKNSLTKEKQKENKTFGALKRLKEKLDLESFPKRIECYDISNLGGTNSVASMVVFTNGEPDKKSYRKFKIKTVEGPNDFLSMHEALTRRIKKIKEEDFDFGEKPNLIVIDGGKGQLSSAYKVLKNSGVTGIEMIGLAKQFEEVFKPESSKAIMLDRRSAELKILQRVRDEAHRFAITFHRSLRSKKDFTSALDKVERLGKNKKVELLKRFGSIEKIKNARVEELEQISGIGKVMAERIIKKLNN